MERINSVVCVVDDDEAYRAGLVDLFRSAGFRVCEFASATELMALQAMPAMACLVVDLKMPGTNGLELRAALTSKGFEPPTILMTAYPTPQVLRDAATLGIRVVIEKPADPDMLLAEVGRCIESSGFSR